jgi:hypothetical protein
MSLRKELGLPVPSLMNEEQRKRYNCALAARTRRNNPEGAKRWCRNFRKNNPLRAKAITQRWRDANPDKVISASQRRHKRDYSDPIKREQAKTRAREYAAKKKRENPAFRVMAVQRSRLSGLLRGSSWKRTSKTLSFSTEELRETIERRFKPGMTWENYGIGSGKWHIDHIVPCSQFDLLNPDEVKKCFALSNLQPMWGRENIQKSDKVMKQVELPLEMPGQPMQ